MTLVLRPFQVQIRHSEGKAAVRTNDCHNQHWFAQKDAEKTILDSFVRWEYM